MSAEATRGAKEDQEDLLKAIAEMQSSPDGRQGLLLRRLLLSSTNPVFAVDMTAALRDAFKVAAEAHPHSQLLEVVFYPFYFACVMPNTAACAALLQPDHEADSAWQRDRRWVGAMVCLRRSCEGSLASLHNRDDVDVGFVLSLQPACLTAGRPRGGVGACHTWAPSLILYYLEIPLHRAKGAFASSGRG